MIPSFVFRLSYVLQSGGNDYQVVLRPPKVDHAPPFAPSKHRTFGKGGGQNGGKGSSANKKISGGGSLSSLWAEDAADSAPLPSSTASSASTPSPLTQPLAAVRLDIVCLRAARPFAFATQEARSVLLASGTLAPHQPLAHELGLEVPSTPSNEETAPSSSLPKGVPKPLPPPTKPPVVSSQPAQRQPPPPKVRKMEWSTGKSIATIVPTPPGPPLSNGEATEADGSNSSKGNNTIEDTVDDDDDDDDEELIVLEPPARPYVWSSADHHAHVDQMVRFIP